MVYFTQMRLMSLLVDYRSVNREQQVDYMQQSQTRKSFEKKESTAPTSWYNDMKMFNFLIY